ncbi:hypothetical protein LCGC14_0234950 [marine sediment metagenome]|uniref:Uncharacterized protein n=1 Tax=marine sediment metagenome TaxID=412755 RepID=A0A0F9UDA7_9ZZZZ
MNYAEATKELRRTGTKYATGDSLCAMCAKLIIDVRGFRRPVLAKLYTHFQQLPDDNAIYAENKRILTDPFAIFDVI